ncbi:MAG: hypothetical protein RIT19_300 [Verrucomicrobiota bacterium]|jgi:prepilin-type N-terminal cleavage/methylation domain-containing protein
MKVSGPSASRTRGFTLIEVVLAIVIAVGLLTGVLVFYRQAAVLREEILRKADHLSAVRLVMDRISTELRTAPPGTGGAPVVSGDSRSLRMLHTTVPSRTPWRGGTLGRSGFGEADWVEVSYRCSTDTNQPGLFRQERIPAGGATVATNLPTDLETAGGVGTNTFNAPIGIPLSEAIRHLGFRYWDGSRWLNAWDRAEPPTAVEVSLGLEPPDEEEALADDSDTGAPEEYPFEVFRRVIALPTAATPSPTPIPDTGMPSEEAPAP